MCNTEEDRPALRLDEDDTIQDAEREISAWLSENWSEIRDGAEPGLSELARRLQLIFRSLSMEPNMHKEAALQRIAEIDKMFEEALGWGSWMVMAANEREVLAAQHNLPHKYQARTASGAHTD